MFLQYSFRVNISSIFPPPPPHPVIVLYHIMLKLYIKFAIAIYDPVGNL